MARRSAIDGCHHDLTVPQTKTVEKPVLTKEQILALIGAIELTHKCSAQRIANLDEQSGPEGKKLSTSRSNSAKFDLEEAVSI